MLNKAFESIATFISHVLNPPIVAFVVLFLCVIEEDLHRAPQFAQVLVYSILVGFVVPFIYTIILQRFKVISNFFYSRKKDRIFLFPALLITLVSILIIVRNFGTSHVIIRYLEISLILFFIVLFITPMTKISLHMVGITSIFVIALWVWGMRALYFTPCVPLVAWARVYLRQHSANQVLLGTLVGGSTTLALLIVLPQLLR